MRRPLGLGSHRERPVGSAILSILPVHESRLIFHQHAPVAASNAPVRRQTRLVRDVKRRNRRISVRNRHFRPVRRVICGWLHGVVFRSREGADDAGKDGARDHANTHGDRVARRRAVRERASHATGGKEEGLRRTGEGGPWPASCQPKVETSPFLQSRNVPFLVLYKSSVV